MLTVLSLIWTTSFVLFTARFISAEYAVCSAGEPCISIEKCESIKDQLKIKGMTPKLGKALRSSTCGYVERIPKVCCPYYCKVLGIEGTCRNKNDCPGLQRFEKEKYENMFLYNDVHKNYRCYPEKVCCPNPCVATDLPSPLRECCGIGTASARIFDGHAAGLDQYPWTVIIKYKDPRIMCEGSLISGRYVLTAAHCVDNEIDHVVVGDYDIENSGPDCVYNDCTDGERKIRVSHVIPHMSYSFNLKLDDIALLRLEELAPFTEFVQPVCLPTVWSIARMWTNQMLVMGWGAVNSTVAKSRVKRVAVVDYVDNGICTAELTGRNMTKKNICVKGKRGQEACAGDSGGPLVQYSGLIKRFQIIGIHSYGTKVCGLKRPSAYTNVVEYLDWIYEMIDKTEFSEQSKNVMLRGYKYSPKY